MTMSSVWQYRYNKALKQVNKKLYVDTLCELLADRIDLVSSCDRWNEIELPWNVKVESRGRARGSCNTGSSPLSSCFQNDT